jgi:hypothetical protein
LASLRRICDAKIVEERPEKVTQIQANEMSPPKEERIKEGKRGRTAKDRFYSSPSSPSLIVNLAIQMLDTTKSSKPPPFST